MRGLVFSKIETDRDASQFANNEFDLVESYLPFAELVEFPSDGRVTLIGLASGLLIADRNKLCRREIPIQIAYQRKVQDVTNTTEINQYVELYEQLQHASKLAADATDKFAFLRVDPLLDENGTPYHFTSLREKATFEAYFTAFFQVFE